MRRLGTAVAVVALVAGLANWGLPWLLRDRGLPAAVPSPRALFAVDQVPIAPGRSACSRDVAVDPRAGVATLHVMTGRTPAPPLTLSLRGAGYSSSARIAGNYATDDDVSFAVAPPARATLVTACVHNDGRHRVALAASSDRTRSRSLTTVDGRPTGKSAWLSFEEARDHSMLARANDTVRRIGVFRPGIVGPWLLWPLAVLFLAGIPAGAAWAWDRALRDDERGV
jgi:hypothetical protein